MSIATRQLAAVVVIASLFAAGASAQTQILEKLGGLAGAQAGAAVAFGTIKDPNSTNQMRVFAVGQPVSTGLYSVDVFDGVGNLVDQAQYFAGGSEFGSCVAFGKVASFFTPAQVLLVGAPGAFAGWIKIEILDNLNNGATVFGTQTGERFGHSLAVVGKIDGDGIEDFIVGAPLYDVGISTDTGRVRVYAGASLNTYTLIRDHVGAGVNHRFGWSVAGISDVDNDGVPDYAIGAPGYSSDTGRVYVYSGATGAAIPALQKTGAAAGEQFGYSVAGVGDMNLDGRPDYAVGAPDFTGFPGLGRVDVFSGLDGSLIWSLPGGSVNGHLGASLAGGGDVDRDGVPDLITGAPDASSGKGQFRVYSGRTGAVLYLLGGTQAGESLGAAVALGQLNDDAYAELAVGRPLYNGTAGADSGAASIYTGAVRWRIDSSLPDFGRSVDVAGDVNGDGYDDIIVGSGTSLAPAPKWQIFDGRTSQLMREGGPASAQATYLSVSGLSDITGDGRAEYIIGNAGDHAVEVRGGLIGGVIFNLAGPHVGFGHSVADAGDLTGDGIHDIIVGSPFATNATANLGGIWIYSGATGVLLQEHYGATTSWLGYSVCAAGDVNNDGVNDYAEGAPKYAVGGFEFGRVQIKSGVSNTVVATILGAPGQNSHCGWAVDELGDMNNDGYDDIIVGEPDYDNAAGTAAGRARVFLGGPAGVQVLHTIEGLAADHCGRSVAGVGDVDRDGWKDFAVGFPFADLPGAGTCGLVRVYSGQTGLLLLERAGAGGDFFGEAIGASPSAGPDGRNELVIGAQPGFLAMSHILVVQMPVAKSETIGAAGCAGGPTLQTGTTGVCAATPNGCSVPQGSPAEAPGLPILGEELVVKVTAPPNSTFYLFGSNEPPAPTPIGGGCLAYLDLNNLTQLPAILIGPSGTNMLGLYLPEVPALLGLSGVIQGVVLPIGGGFAVSNAIRLTVGLTNHSL